MAREVAEELDDLRNMVVVFAVLSAGLRVKEVVAGNKLEDLEPTINIPQNLTGSVKYEQRIHTIQAILQISVLAPHFAPKMTSGDLYCRV